LTNCYEEKTINDAVSDLLQVFNSKINEHITYVLTGVLAFFTLVQIRENIPNTIFLIVFCGFVVGEVYFLIRTLMWTKYANIVIQVTDRVKEVKPEYEKLGIHHRLFLETQCQFAKENRYLVKISSREIKQRICLLLCVTLLFTAILNYVPNLYSSFEAHFGLVVIILLLVFFIFFLALFLKQDC